MLSDEILWQYDGSVKWFMCRIHAKDAICTYKAKNKSDVKRHMRKIHGIETWMACKNALMDGTPCPYKGSIGDAAQAGWLANVDDAPSESKYVKKKVTIKTNEMMNEEMSE